MISNLENNSYDVHYFEFTILCSHSIHTYTTLKITWLEFPLITKYSLQRILMMYTVSKFL